MNLIFRNFVNSKNNKLNDYYLAMAYKYNYSGAVLLENVSKRYLSICDIKPKITPYGNKFNEFEIIIP